MIEASKRKHLDIDRANGGAKEQSRLDAVRENLLIQKTCCHENKVLSSRSVMTEVRQVFTIKGSTKCVSEMERS